MISKEDIENLAELARLELTPEEVSSLQKDVSNILEYVGQITAVSIADDTHEVPLVHNVLRADLPRETNDPLGGKRESILNGFPKREGDYAVVRKIIQKDE